MTAPYTLTTFNLPAGATGTGTGSGQQSIALFVNDDGEVAGQYDAANAVEHGFEYQNGVFTTFDPSGSTRTTVVGLSNNGQIAGNDTVAGGASLPYVYNGLTTTSFSVATSTSTTVSAQSGTGIVAGADVSPTPGVDDFVYNQGVVTIYDPAKVTGGVDKLQGSTVLAVSGNGTVGGLYQTASGIFGFVYSGGVATNVGVTGELSSKVVEVNNSGEAAGFYTDSSSASHAFFYDGTIHGLQLPGPPVHVTLAGLNNAGQLVGDFTDGQSVIHGFIYANDASTVIDPTGTTDTTIVGISDTGVVAGYYIDGSGVSHGFVYSNGTYATIDEPGALDTSITSISSAGVIAGQYEDASGVIHGFVGMSTGLTTVGFQGTAAQYNITSANGAITVADTVAGRDGTDVMAAVQQLHFTDYTLVFDLHSSEDLLVYQLYQAAYGRTPDNAGFRYWAGVADANGSSGQFLADQFLSAPEFTQLYGANPTNTAYVTELYTNVLGRTPDPAGLAYWIGQANAGLAHDQLMVAFATSSENVQLIGAHVTTGYWTT